ncbi:MAG: hypothetical protein CBE05_004970, partial [Candidatus Puniceispirillum sp. TMED245]
MPPTGIPKPDWEDVPPDAPRSTILPVARRAGGTMLVEIVPSKAEYLVRAQINPQDIADVQPGQVTRIS